VAGLVSVVIPVFNRAAMLRQAVASVAAQTYSSWEIVIVDDGSTDDTPASIGELEVGDPRRIRSLRQENAGPGAAREAGRRAARGEFLQFLDSDDLLLPRKFELQVASLRSEPAAGASYGPTRERLPDGSVRGPIRRTGDPLARLFPALLGGRLWITATPLYRAQVCAAAGGWSDLRFDEDWEFEARIGALGVALAHVGEAVAERRFHGGAHAGAGEPSDPARLRQQARAHESILASAGQAQVEVGAPERNRFSRTLFLLARRCGAAGLTEESRRLFGLARDAAGPARAAGLDFRVYRAFAAVLGWTLAGRLAVLSDRWRGPGEGPSSGE
jgi:hypothetical protein